MSLSCSPSSTWFHHPKTTIPIPRNKEQRDKKRISRKGTRRRRKQRGCQFSSCSKTACEKDDFGHSSRWIVLRFVGCVIYFFFYDWTVGIIVMISGSLKNAAGQKGCDTVYL
ncbi:unnamed protein product [Linum tenue]|uniref:Uncharacterized protein n=1 Tax=Linum tenue TaxID=586396 RepID=A0AAV0MNQ6_9ROSI|nr:unnamed protein product [Linum tenue]